VVVSRHEPHPDPVGTASGLRDAQVASGDFPDAEAVVAEGLDLLRSEIDAEAKRLERFRAEVQVGVDQIERGEGIDIDDQTAWLNGLGRRKPADAAA
jgi:antitoxin ParD1/3/4